MGVRQVLTCLFILGVSSSQLIAASDFIWPLQQNYGISATFGESRDDHFHAGVDLSTNGETGLPVLAVADGMIYRMKIQKRAYGKALYIRHSDGRISLYAHLEGYSKELGLEKLYQEKVAQMKTRYVGDIFVEPTIRVKQGDIVAYSGESGAGLPHLHFELRKNETVAVNPLSNGLHDTSDPVPPTFQACYFYPLSGESAINGNLDTKEVRFKKNETGFVSDSVPVVRGDFIISVSVYDSALRPYHRAPQKLTYSVDRHEVYSVDFDQVAYDQPDGFGLFYDLGKPGPSYYEFPVILAKLADFAVPFVSKTTPFSTRNLPPGNHEITIQASDSNNNVSIAAIPFVVNHPPRFNVNSVGADISDLILNATVSDPDGSANISSLVEYSIDEGKTFSSFAKSNTANNAAAYEYRASLNPLRSAHSVLIRARAFDGIEYSPYEFRRIRPGPSPVEFPPEIHSEGNLRYETYRDTIRVIFETDSPIPGKLQVSAGDPASSFPLEAREPTSRVASIPAPKQSAVVKVALESQSLNIPVNFAYANKPLGISNGNFQLSIPANGLYFDSFIWTKLLPEYRSKSLPLAGPMLQLGPRGLPLNKDAELSLPYKSTVLHPEKLSIYRWDRVRQKWTSLPSKIDPLSKTVKTRVSYLDLYALLYDNEAPVIKSVFPKRNSVTSNNSPTLVAGIQDAGMDVDDEKITFFVDGVPYPADYDPDRNTASLKMPTVLKNGYHRFFVKAFDYGENKAQSAAISFRVK